MTSRVLMTNALRARVTNHLWVNKNPYTDPSSTGPSSRTARFHYAWKPDRAEAHRIKRLSKGYDQPIIIEGMDTKD
jgi:hypothetical protein